MKIAILNDTHAGAKNGSDIFLNYQERFYTEIFFPYLKKHKIKRILHLGDYYDHRRVVNFKVIERNREHFLNQLRKNKIHMDVIPGNHDVYYRNSNDLCSLKELLGHYMDCVTIHMKPTVLDFDGLNIGMLPWVTQDNIVECNEFIETCAAPILMGHLELAGFRMMANSAIVSHGDIPSKFKRFEAVYSGHYHTKSAQDNITYLGTQMEFTWSDCNDPKFFHVFDTSTRELAPVRNPITLYKKIIYEDHGPDDLDPDDVRGKYVKVVIVSKKDHYLFEKFSDKLQASDPLDISIVENFDDLQGDAISDDDLKMDDTPSLLSSYIDNVETDLKRNVLKKLVMQVYAEAQDAEAL